MLVWLVLLIIYINLAISPLGLTKHNSIVVFIVIFFLVCVEDAGWADWSFDWCRRDGLQRPGPRNAALCLVPLRLIQLLIHEVTMELGITCRIEFEPMGVLSVGHVIRSMRMRCQLLLADAKGR